MKPMNAAKDQAPVLPDCFAFTNFLKRSQVRVMKAFKAAILFAAFALVIAHPAGAGLYQITFNDGNGNAGAGQIDVECANGNYSACAGYLNVNAGGAVGNWTLYTASSATPYPGYNLSPAGAYWYNNAVYPTGNNPQYSGTGALLDVYGLLFTQSNGNELNLWGNADGSYTLGGNVGGWQNFNVQISLQGTTITPVPEPITLALPIFGGLVLTTGLARRFISRRAGRVV
jgi:hypothetical protein